MTLNNVAFYNAKVCVCSNNSQIVAPVRLTNVGVGGRGGGLAIDPDARVEDIAGFTCKPQGGRSVTGAAVAVSPADAPCIVNQGFIANIHECEFDGAGAGKRAHVWRWATAASM